MNRSQRERELQESRLTIRSPQILYNKLDCFRSLMIKGIIETLKVLFIGERNCVFVFIDESDNPTPLLKRRSQISAPVLP